MQFSIIIPCYNVAAFLHECLESVLTQSFMDWEAVCVDDGSTDDTGHILDEYAAKDARIRVVHQENGGLSVARNTGLRHATGEYLLFLDSDDVLTPGALDILHQQIATYQPDVLTFNAELWYAEENRRERHYYSRDQHATHASGSDYLIHFVQQHHWGPAAACFYSMKRSLIVDNELWFQPGLLHEDELWVPTMLLHTQGRVVEIPQTLYLYRMRSGSIMHSESEKAYRDMLYIGARLEEELKSYPLPKAIKHYIVLNNVRHGLLGLKVLGVKIPSDDLKLAWRCATWKQRVKLIIHLLK